MAGKLDYYGYDDSGSELISQKQQLLDNQAKVDNKQDEIIQEIIDHDVSGGTDLILVTYSELLSMRDGGRLSKGTWYRITDYITTTTQENTRSNSNQFDIIVLALDNHTLNENAFAMRHDGDTYFSASTLTSWKVWYCLDNDVNRFVWADSENGKGVIYRLIDEHNIDCPYDFYNIEFYITSDDYSNWFSPIFENQIITNDVYNIVIKENHNSNKISLPFVITSYCHDIYVNSDCNNVFISYGSYDVNVDIGCSGITLVHVYDFKIGYYCENIETHGDNEHIEIGNYNVGITMGGGVYHSSLGGYNKSIVIESGDEDIHIDNYNENITIEGGCESVNIGCNNNNITLDSEDKSIDIGNYNENVTIGGGNNTIGVGNENKNIEIHGGNDSINIGCYNRNITIGAGNYSIDIGDYNTEITMDDGNDSVGIGNDNENITMSDGSTSVLIRDFNKYITFSGDSFVDVVIDYDVCGTDVDNPLVISDSNITVMKNSQGEVKMFNIADLVQ